MVIGTIIAISPLVTRNMLVGAPPLSSSNCFAESFILGNAGGSSPFQSVIPSETGEILLETQGRGLAVIRETLKSHRDGWRGLVQLQFLKLLSLLDPFEAPDNLSFYFVAHISPVVRFGLRYWMLWCPAWRTVSRDMATGTIAVLDLGHVACVCG